MALNSEDVAQVIDTLSKHVRLMETLLEHLRHEIEERKRAEQRRDEDWMHHLDYVVQTNQHINALYEKIHQLEAKEQARLSEAVYTMGKAERVDVPGSEVEEG